MPFGNDIMDGGLEDDVLQGGDGNDVFLSSGGSDTVDGGAGADIVQFTGSFSEYTRTTLTDGRIVTAALSGTGPHINYAIVSGNTVVGVDFNGDHTADFQIEMTGVHTLTSSDFVL